MEEESGNLKSEQSPQKTPSPQRTPTAHRTQRALRSPNEQNPQRTQRALNEERPPRAQNEQSPQKTPKRRIYYLTGVVVALILWLTLGPPPVEEKDIHLFPHADKVVHLLMFMGAVVAYAADRWRMRLRVSGIRMIFVCVAAIILGGLIEIAQGLMGAGRSGDYLDLLADGIGAITGVAIVLTIQARRGIEKDQDRR